MQCWWIHMKNWLIHDNTFFNKKTCSSLAAFKYALSACHVSCTALGQEDTKIGISSPLEPHRGTEKTHNNQIRGYYLIRVTTEGSKVCMRLTGEEGLRRASWRKICGPGKTHRSNHTTYSRLNVWVPIIKMSISYSPNPFNIGPLGGNWVKSVEPSWMVLVTFRKGTSDSSLAFFPPHEDTMRSQPSTSQERDLTRTKSRWHSGLKRQHQGLWDVLLCGL